MGSGNRGSFSTVFFSGEVLILFFVWIDDLNFEKLKLEVSLERSWFNDYFRIFCLF